MNYILIFETALYYCSLLLFVKCILNCKPRKLVLILSFLLFAPALIAEKLGSDTYVTLFDFLFMIGQFLLIRVIFPDVKLRYPLFFFLFMNCINIMLIGTVANSININGIYADITCNAVTAALWAVVCLTGLRHKLRQLLLFTPKYVLTVSGILFISLIMVEISGAGQTLGTNSELWEACYAVGVSLLKLTVCIAFPAFVIVTASNSQLKQLTSRYEQQIRAQAEHYQALSEANWEVRRFRHDFKNTRIAIEKLLADGEHAQALDLLQACGDVLDTPNHNAVWFDTGNGIADALLTDKQKRAAQCNAVITFRGAIPQKGLSPTDLCVILGNTLDNAIEACEKLPSGNQNTIAVTCSCSSGFLFLMVQNPIAEKVTIRDNHIVTTKPDKTLHGYGLLSLHSVVEKYDGTVKLSAVEGGFTVNIDLCLSGDDRSVK